MTAPDEGRRQQAVCHTTSLPFPALVAALKLGGPPQEHRTARPEGSCWYTRWASISNSKSMAQR